MTNACLRPGNTAECSNCLEIMRVNCEEPLRGVGCIIAGRAYDNFKHEIHGMKNWVEVCLGIAVKE